MDIKLLTSLLASEAVEKNIFVLSIFSQLIWLQLVSGAKIRFYNIFANYLEPPRSLRGHLAVSYTHLTLPTTEAV